MQTCLAVWRSQTVCKIEVLLRFFGESPTRNGARVARGGGERVTSCRAERARRLRVARPRRARHLYFTPRARQGANRDFCRYQSNGLQNRVLRFVVRGSGFPVCDVISVDYFLPDMPFDGTRQFRYFTALAFEAWFDASPFAEAFAFATHLGQELSSPSTLSVSPHTTPRRRRTSRHHTGSGCSFGIGRSGRR